MRGLLMERIEVLEAEVAVEKQARAEKAEAYAKAQAERDQAYAKAQAAQARRAAKANAERHVRSKLSTALSMRRIALDRACKAQHWAPDGGAGGRGAYGGAGAN